MKKVYPCKPQFYYIKVGCKGVFVTQTCFRDVLIKSCNDCIFSKHVDMQVYKKRKRVFENLLSSLVNVICSCH